MVAASRHLQRVAPVLACGLAVAAGGCALGGGSSGREAPSLARGGTIRGGGATLAAPLYRTWAAGFRAREGTDVRYEAIGFSRGVSEFTAGLVDFGTTDAPLNDVEVTTAARDKSKPVHIPVAFGAVAVAYRLPAAGGGLRLDGATLAAMFLGRITRWNAPAIRKLNPGRRLPATPIGVVHRADSSGTTRLFTSYLAGGSREWSRRVGTDEAVAWPVGTSAPGNSELERTMAARPGSIGYVDAGASRPGLSRARLPNRTGRFVAPTPAGIAAATRRLQDVPADLRFLAVDASPDPGAYPVASAIFMLVYRDLCRAKIQPDSARHVRRWLRFMLGASAQRLAAAAPGYAALPDEIAARARRATDRLTCDGRRL
ncbi:MAG: phosphate ABC transporter substrate-binding protein PstS [Actinomycetota bacterium]|nr:phosphate ABC transporter substrate-binding protein PstS [Actinomycetota bacterium]